MNRIIRLQLPVEDRKVRLGVLHVTCDFGSPAEPAACFRYYDETEYIKPKLAGVTCVSKSGIGSITVK